MVTKREFNRIKKENPESRIWQREWEDEKRRNDLYKTIMKAEKKWEVHPYVESYKKQLELNDMNLKLKEDTLEYERQMKKKYFVDKEKSFWILWLPQEIVDFRNEWLEKQQISDEAKNKIVSATEKMDYKVEIDYKWERTVRFKLWNKIYKIVDLKLSDQHYFCNSDLNWYSKRKYYYVAWSNIKWNDVNNWDDKEVSEYVNLKMWEWFHMPSRWEIKSLLWELWKQANLHDYEEQFAMFIYLTWMLWEYRLQQEDESGDMRWIITLNNKGWAKGISISWNGGASLFMMSCES